jgi:putative tryptophan/tyrosine transport system substrate-binding protein
LISVTTPATSALAHETTTIPIIFMQVSDPVGSGLVTNLARPSGNITGFTNFEYSMGGKWLETLKEAAPHIARVGVLFNPETAPYVKFYIESIKVGAGPTGIEVTALTTRDAANLDTTIAEFAKDAKGGLIVPSDIFTTVNRDLIVATAAKYQVPAVYPFRFFAVNGGLISYGIENIDLYRRAAAYADNILRGAKVADLPIQQPTKFELIINLKTAKALGLTLPASLLTRADEVIE